MELNLPHEEFEERLMQRLKEEIKLNRKQLEQDLKSELQLEKKRLLDAAVSSKQHFCLILYLYCVGKRKASPSWRELKTAGRDLETQGPA